MYSKSKMSIKRLILGGLAGIIASIAVSCTDQSIDNTLPEDPTQETRPGEPLYGQVDGCYDKETIIDMAESPENITEFTPEFIDFINEFYAATAYHGELEDIYFQILADVPDYEDGQEVLGRYHHSDGKPHIDVEEMAFSPFFFVFKHEVSHQHEHGTGTHDKLEVNELAKTMLLYAFEPQIATSILIGHFPSIEYDDGTTTAPPLFDLGQKGYGPLFWNYLSESGNVNDSLDYINFTQASLLDEEMDLLDKTVVNAQTIEPALNKLQQTGSLNSIGNATEGQLTTFFSYLLLEANPEDENEVCSQYLGGLSVVLEEGTNPNPTFLGRFMGCIGYDLEPLEPYLPLIEAVEVVDSSLWPSYDGSMINTIYQRILSVAHYLDGNESDLSEEELEIYSGNLSLATELAREYLQKHEVSQGVLSEVLMLLGKLMDYPHEFGKVLEIDYVSAAGLYPLAFHEFYGDIDAFESLDWVFASHMKQGVNAIFQTAQEDPNNVSIFYEDLDSITNGFLDIYGEICSPDDDLYFKEAKAYALATQAILAYKSGDTTSADNLLTEANACGISFDGVIEQELSNIE